MRRFLSGLMRRLLLALRWTGTVDVVIYSKYPRFWRRQLNAGAPVWQLLPQVRNVTIVPEGRTVPRPGRLRQMVIPLLEKHILGLPLPAVTLIPRPTDVTTFRNKADFARFIATHGLSDYAPRLFASPGDVVFPAVLKRTDLSAGRGVVVVDSRDDLDRRLAEPPWRGEEVIIQELIEGASEYVTHMVCVDGALLWHLSYEYPNPSTRHIKQSAQSGWTRHWTAPPEIVDIVQRFPAAIGFTGPLNIAYKLRDGKPLVFEINARLGQSLMLPENVADLAACLAVIIANARLTQPDAAQ